MRRLRGVRGCVRLTCYVGCSQARKKTGADAEAKKATKQKVEEDKAEEKARQKQQRVGYLSGISLECGMLTVRMQGAAKLHGDVLVSTSGRSRFAREAG